MTICLTGYYKELIIAHSVLTKTIPANVIMVIMGQTATRFVLAVSSPLAIVTEHAQSMELASAAVDGLEKIAACANQGGPEMIAHY